VFFDTLCVSFSFVFFKFLVFEAAIYANADVYIILGHGVYIYRVAQNKIPHRRICNISATNGQILKILEAA